MGSGITRFVTVPIFSNASGTRAVTSELHLTVSEDQGVTQIEGLELHPGQPTLGQIMVAAIRSLKLTPPVVLTHEGVEVNYRGAVTHWSDDAAIAQELDDQWKLKQAQLVLVKEQGDVLRRVIAEQTPLVDPRNPVVDLFEAVDLRVDEELVEEYGPNIDRAFSELAEPMEVFRYLRAMIPRIAPVDRSRFFETLALGVVGADPAERARLATRMASWVEASLTLLPTLHP